MCVYVTVGLLVSYYWKLALGNCSKQVKTKHHLRVFIFIFLTASCRQSLSVLLMSTYAALGVGLMLYQQGLSSIYSFREVLLMLGWPRTGLLFALRVLTKPKIATQGSFWLFPSISHYYREITA